MKTLRRITDWSASIATISIFIMTLAITFGVITRLFNIQDFYSFDISLYALVWFSMLGAGLTARTGKHVTAGIALENFIKTKLPIIPLIRSFLVIVIMIIILWAGFSQTYSSFKVHEVTTSIVQFPVWISKLPIALGALAWIVGEVGRMVETVVSFK